jgi:phosphoribosylformylglycinamidine synthase
VVKIDLDTLPVGELLCAKEIVVTNLRKRIGLVIAEKNYIATSKNCRSRTFAMYKVGEVTNDHRFTFESKSTGENLWLALKTFWFITKNDYDGQNRCRNYSDHVIKQKFKIFRVSFAIEAVACKIG